MLQTSANSIFCSEFLYETVISFDGFVQILSRKPTTSLKSSALVPYPLHAVLLNFRKEFKYRLIPGVHSCLAFLFVEIIRSEGMRKADIGEPRESVYGYSTTQILDAEEWIQKSSKMKESEKKISMLHQSLLVNLKDLQSTCAGVLC